MSVRIPCAALVLAILALVLGGCDSASFRRNLDDTRDKINGN